MPHCRDLEGLQRMFQNELACRQAFQRDFPLADMGGADASVDFYRAIYGIGYRLHLEHTIQKQQKMRIVIDEQHLC